MRLSVLSIFLAVLTVVVAARIPAPQPGLRQVSRQELRARAQHPDLFKKRDTADAEPSGLPSECEAKRQRRNFNEAEGVLNARDTAAFLMGRGTFEWPNGTVYVDEDFVYRSERAADVQAGWTHRLYNVVRDNVGNKLLEMSVPHYKKWKTALKHGDLIYLSDLTAVRTQEVEELERILLADPNFTDVVVHGFRIDRRFFEVANSY